MKRHDSIRKLREHLDLSQRGFAHSIGRSSVSISLHESGRQPLGWKTLQRITRKYPSACKKLSITFEKLMAEKVAATKATKAAVRR